MRGRTLHNGGGGARWKINIQMLGPVGGGQSNPSCDGGGQGWMEDVVIVLILYQSY